MFNIIRFAPQAAFLCGISLLSGCMQTDALQADSARISSHATDNYPISAGNGVRNLDIDSRRDHLSPAQASGVRRFLASAQTVHAPQIYIEQSGAQSPGSQVTTEIINLATLQGFSRENVLVSTYAGHAGDPTRIAYYSSRPDVKPCGNWPDDLTESSDNGPYSNLGCAVQNNIAAMVDKPQTLAKPAPVEMAPADSRAAAIDRANKDVNAITLPNNYTFTK